MPRKGSDETITHRIELGVWERQHAEGVLTAIQLDKMSESLSQLLTLEKAYLLITLVEIITGKEILWGTPNDLQDLIQGVKDWYTSNKAEIDAAGGFWRWLAASAGLGPHERTPEEIARAQSQAEVWANAFGITVDPETGEVGEYTAPTYASPADVWGQSFGLDPE